MDDRHSIGRRYGPRTATHGSDFRRPRGRDPRADDPGDDQQHGDQSKGDRIMRCHRDDKLAAVAAAVNAGTLLSEVRRRVATLSTT